MKQIYKLEKRNKYYCIISGNRVIYKSKDEMKTKSRYNGLMTVLTKQMTRENSPFKYL